MAMPICQPEFVIKTLASVIAQIILKVANVRNVPKDFLETQQMLVIASMSAMLKISSEMSCLVI